MKSIHCACAAMLLSFCLPAATARTSAAAKAAEKPPQIAETSQKLTPFEQALVDAENGFIAAAEKGDLAYMKRTLADDYSFVGFDGQAYERQDMLDGFGGAGVKLEPYNLQVIPMGDDAGIVSYDLIFRVPASEDEGPPPRYQHWSTVWVKRDGQWKIKFQQTTPTHWGDW